MELEVLAVLKAWKRLWWPVPSRRWTGSRSSARATCLPRSRSCSTRPIRLSATPSPPELASLLDIREESRAGVISALWSYVKEKKLLDETDRKKVKCDPALRSLFATDTINFHHMPEVVNRHLHPAQPIVIEYWIRTDKAEYKHSTAYDIELDLEDLAIRQKQHNVLSQFDSANDSTSREIAELDDKIAQAAATIRNRASARDFLAAFAKDPQGQLTTWIASQARDLDAILGNNAVPGAAGSVASFTAEEMRRAETFRASGSMRR